MTSSQRAELGPCASVAAVGHSRGPAENVFHARLVIFISPCGVCFTMPQITVLSFDGSAAMTSPRSVRACKALGINQELELMNKGINDFLDRKEARTNKDLATELARMELENYEKVRDNLLEQVRRKRATFIHLEESSSPTSRSPSNGGGEEGAADDDSSLVKELSKRQQKIVEAERERLQKLKDRQFNELQRAVELENLQAVVRVPPSAFFAAFNFGAVTVLTST